MTNWCDRASGELDFDPTCTRTMTCLHPYGQPPLTETAQRRTLLATSKNREPSNAGEDGVSTSPILCMTRCLG